MASLLLTSIKKRGSWLLWPLLLLGLSACSSVFFYPMSPWVQNPALSGLDYEDVVLIHEDGTRISGWWLPAKTPLRGTVYFLHGNAQNISTQMRHVGWLPEQGFQVLLIDYQGYGLSDGKPGLEAAISDIQLGLDWLNASGRLHEKPLVVYAQSLGASMGAWVLSQQDNKDKYRCFIEEGGFADYRDIVNLVMKRSWLLWPLRPLVVPFIDNQYAPDKVVADLSPKPLMLIHSREDEVVPLSQGDAFFVAAKQPREMLVTDGPHAMALQQPGVRSKVLSFMERRCGISAPGAPEAGVEAPSADAGKEKIVTVPEEWKF